MSNTKEIAALNDRFRSGDKSLGKFVMTQGVSCLTGAKLAHLINLVRKFKNFTLDNDPWREHDLGKITFDGEEYFFKIDYFDPTFTSHSEDAANPEITRRVLTLMRCDEY